MWEGESACSPGAPTAPPETPGEPQPPCPPEHLAGGVWLLGRKDPASCHLPGVVPRGRGCGDLPTLSAVPSPPPRQRSLSSPRHRVAWGSARVGCGCSGKGGSPPPRFLGAAERTCARPARGPGARPPLQPGAWSPYLATRRSPSRGRGAAALRLGCVGQPGAHVSAGLGSRAAPAQLEGGWPGGAEGAGAPLAAAAAPPGRARRRLPRRARSAGRGQHRRRGPRGPPAQGPERPAARRGPAPAPARLTCCRSPGWRVRGSEEAGGVREEWLATRGARSRTSGPPVAPPGDRA